MSDAKKDPTDVGMRSDPLFQSLLKRVDDLEKLCAMAPGDEDFKRLRERIVAAEKLIEDRHVVAMSNIGINDRSGLPVAELRFEPLPHVRNKDWLPQRDGEYLLLRNVPKATAAGVNVRDGEYKSLPTGVKFTVPQGYLAAVGQVIDFGGAHQVQNVVYVSPGHTAEVEVLCTCPRGRRDYFPTPGDGIGIAWLVPAPKFAARGALQAPMAQPAKSDDKLKA